MNSSLQICLISAAHVTLAALSNCLQLYVTSLAVYNFSAAVGDSLQLCYNFCSFVWTSLQLYVTSLALM